MGKESIITIQITRTGTFPQSEILYHVLQDERVIASNQSLSRSETEALSSISRQYGSLFEQRGTPQLSIKEQESIGGRLFSLWLASSWDKIQVASGSKRTLVIASDMPDVLNLPWELLLPPDGDFLGIDPLFSIRRLPNAKELARFDGELRARPLRLLFLACAPTDQHPLDFELEEDALLKAISADVIYDSGDMGSFDELCQKVTRLQPHVVHLTGHGIVGRICPNCNKLNEPEVLYCRKCSVTLKDTEPLGYFAFEDESGHTDLRSSKEIRRKLAGSGVQCVFISGCQSSKAPPVEALGGICKSLVSKEVPMAIGWAASIADEVATQFAHIFYEALAAPRDVDYAINHARQYIWERCNKEDNPSWTLPVLYISTNQGMIFDPDLQRSVEVPQYSSIVQQPLPGMTEGYAEYFVGRRRVQQRLLPALKDGSLQVLVLTGIGGSGKSSLATRLARKLQADGFNLIPVSSFRNNPLNAARLFDACSTAFLQAAASQRSQGDEIKARRLEGLCQILDSPLVSVKARLQNMVATLNSDRFLL